MTVCDLCKGTGKLLKPWYDTTGAMTGMTGDICFMCDGKGTIGEPMTNEEWLKSLSTEELANYIATQCADAIRLWRDMQYWTAHEKCKSNKWYVWLKEIHK